MATSAEIQASIGAIFPKLTKRQKEISNLVFEGLKNRQIADMLFVTEKAVKYHLTNIFACCQVKNRRELILLIDRIMKNEKRA